MKHKIKKMGLWELECACGWKISAKNIKGNQAADDKMLDAHATHVEAMRLAGE